jgi:two-component system CheB/CheR fusion protein
MKTQKQTSAEPGTKKAPAKTDSSQFPIVGIGASAGGLEALEQFFGNMPKDSGMAFVVIQHLDPNHVGIMPELLQRITPMKVLQASDRLKVKPNCVYVIPPNKSMSLLNGSLHLFDPVESRGLRLPIDIFFRSLAVDMEEKSIGIILSGMGSDGTLGLKAIKEKNGVVVVQSPASAKFDGMPYSATEAVIADIVAPAEELPAKLIAFLKFIPSVIIDTEIDSKSKSNLEKIIILLREQSGHDLSLYKKSTLFRRIERRKGVHQIDKLQHYVVYLQENPKEMEILFKELLIGVTSFFRDTAVWDMLRDKVLPAMFDELPNGYVLRAWVTACSTGEEAYSLAIVFQEALEKIKKRKNLTLQIFATDLDPDAIELARKGYFSKNIMADVTPERLSRYFNVSGEGYNVITAVREMVVFAPQNVIKDPPFTKLDLLTCRNLLIYMEPELQKKLMALFNYSLNQGGIMLLGTAESLGTHKDGFEEVDLRLKIFKRTVTPISHELIDFPSSFSRTRRVATKELTPSKSAENVQASAEQLMIQRFAPASALVNDKGDIIFITGRTGKYMEHVAGKTNLNIYAMAREGLREVLPNAFRKAMQNFEPVIVRNLKVGTNGGSQLVDITVQRIESPDAIRGMVIVVFTDVPAMIEHDAENPKTGKQRLTGRQKELEIKLQRSYEDLQSTREEMQTSQEELKSTNEELQSTNEELQSTNEELTTSKEEMQSLNEELQTVNVELQSKVGDFIQANNDMKNLLNSTEVATLFLDKELNIRRFTEAVTNIIKLRNSDIGRLFTDLVSNLVYPEIESHARQVLRTLSTIETAITSSDERWFNVRIMPYRTLDDRIDGLVITFTDITFAKKVETELKESELRFRMLYQNSPDAHIISDFSDGRDHGFTDCNQAALDMLGMVSKDQLIATNRIKLSPEYQPDGRLSAEKSEDLIQECIAAGSIRFEWVHCRVNGEEFPVDILLTVFQERGKTFLHSVWRDISERKKSEEALRVSLMKYQTLFDLFPAGITISDSKGQIIETNSIAQRMLGLSPEQQKQRQIDGQEWQIIRPDGSPMPASEYASVRALNEKCQVENVEMGILKGEGQVSWINVSATPVPLEGYGVAIVYTDLTARKQMEDELRKNKESNGKNQ